jgi:hypothetical protein
MPTPSVYFKTAEELEALKARVFLFLMSDEVPSIDGLLGSALFDMVGDQTKDQANAAIASFEAT